MSLYKRMNAGGGIDGGARKEQIHNWRQSNLNNYKTPQELQEGLRGAGIGAKEYMDFAEGAGYDVGGRNWGEDDYRNIGKKTFSARDSKPPIPSITPQQVKSNTSVDMTGVNLGISSKAFNVISTPEDEIIDTLPKKEQKSQRTKNNYADIGVNAASFLSNIQEARNLSRLRKDKYPTKQVAAPAKTNLYDLSRERYEADVSGKNVRGSISSSGMSAPAKAAAAGSLYNKTLAAKSQSFAKEEQLNVAQKDKQSLYGRQAASDRADADYTNKVKEFHKRDDIGVRQVKNLEGIEGKIRTIHRDNKLGRLDKQRASMQLYSSNPESGLHLAKNNPQAFYEATGVKAEDFISQYGHTSLYAKANP